MPFRTLKKVYQTASCCLYSTSIDAYIQSVVIEECSKKETSLLKYFERSSKTNITTAVNNSLVAIQSLASWKTSHSSNNLDLRNQIEYEMRDEKSIPNRKMYFILTYFVKNGDINGVKTIQSILEKHNSTHFKLYSEYNHYLAEAMWIHGKVENSMQLFSVAYNNELVRSQVIVMIKCLFPLLISQHSEAVIHNTIHLIETFSIDKGDYILLTYIWKELFQSEWFSDQLLSKEIVQRNGEILKLITLMIPTMGRILLNQHKIDTFYRLFEFTLEYDLNQDGILIRLLFDYYYALQNIERCSAVVKYTNDKSTSLLTEEQQRRYVSLLLKSKNASISKLNIKKPQHLKYRF